MQNKFHLTPSQEAMLFEKNLPGIVYSAGHFEGLATTRLDTEAILNNVTVAGVKPEAIEIILNLKHALELAKTLPQMDLAAIAQLNAVVQGGGGMRPGTLRTENVLVSLSRDDYVPPLPDAVIATATLQGLEENAGSATETALRTMLYLSKTQLFYDGNKRTALVAANAILYHAGAGILAIPDDKMHWYLSQLQKFYLIGNDAVSNWLYENAVFGIN
ncbi:Fic family protein [Lacticaseibacillus mingshuiensis]|uniref:Fic family protein n=1 Tax=Lacticaseibacillus mingshuiensis TaxID=2799574 RepID=A0ABW4CJ40_9LACO|nr:Fic family protein [Lacticaseibacillus mingshuiensis]